MVSTLFIQNASAQDYTQWHLPDSAKARIGKGWMSGNVAFSPDGKLIAIATSIGIWIYDAHTTKELALLTGHTDNVTSVTFSPDGNHLASSSDDETVRLWDVNTHTQRAILTGHNSWVSSVAFSPEGRTLASGGGGDETVRFWDVATTTLKAILPEHENDIVHLAFSPNGNTLASVTDNTVYLWDTTNYERRMTITRNIDNGDINFVAFSPSGDTLATGNWDDTVSLWYVATGELKATLTGHTAHVQSVAFSPDGNTLASGSSDGTVCLWDVETATYKTTLIRHKDWVKSVAFSPDGNTIASSSTDGTVCFWDAVSHDCVATLNGHITEFASIAFSPDGQTLASGGWDKKVHLWDVASAKLKVSFTGHADEIRAVAFSSDGSTLASTGGFDDPTIRLWDPNSGKLKTRLVGHGWGGVNAIAFSSVNRLIASAGSDGRTCLWNATTGYHRATFIGEVSNVAFSPDGQTLATANGRNGFRVQLWDVTNRAHKAEIRERSYALAFSPNGQTLATGWRDISLWDVNSGVIKTTLSGHTDGIRSIAFSPDGRVLVSGSNDTTMRFWDVENGTQKTVHTVHNAGITDLVFAPDGQTLAAASNDATVLLWDFPLLIESGWEASQLTKDTNLNGVLNPVPLFVEPIPKKTALLANYPNPFNPETWIPYQLANPAEVTVCIYKANGTMIRVLAIGHQPAGIYEDRHRAAYWDGRNGNGESAASGVYFYTLTAGDFTATRKMVVRK